MQHSRFLNTASSDCDVGKGKVYRAVCQTQVAHQSRCLSQFLLRLGALLTLDGKLVHCRLPLRYLFF
jgi:hypothetical protein